MDTDFLHTQMTQAQCTKAILQEIQKPLELFLYHKQRYNVPVNLVLIYTDEDIQKDIESHKRLTDISGSIKLNYAYFYFIFLPFTDTEGTHTFIKHLEKEFLLNIKHSAYFDELENEHHNSFNFINNFLFQISEEAECPQGQSCQVPKA